MDPTADGVSEPSTTQSTGSRKRRTPLPPPPHGPEDLTGVVQNTTPVFTRNGGRTQRDPNEPVIAWLLEAGVHALAHQFCDFEGTLLDGFVNANEILGTVSLNTVMTHFRRLAAQYEFDAGAANRDRIIKRWRTTSGYQRDLMRYVFRTSFHRRRLQAVWPVIEALTELPFGELADTLARSESLEAQSSVELRLQLLLQVGFPNDEQIRALVAETYEHQERAWAAIYEEIFAVYDLTLDPATGWTFVDAARSLSAIVEGAYLRHSAACGLENLESGAHIGVELVRIVASRLTGLPWDELAVRRAVRPPKRPDVLPPADPHDGH